LIRRWLQLRRERKAIKPGDFVTLKEGSGNTYKVHVVEDKEVTVFDNFTGEYETYPLNKVYPLTK